MADPLRKFTFIFLIFFGCPWAWAGEDRAAAAEKYLEEFCSLQRFPVIYQAIKSVLEKMPREDFLKVTDRRRPAIFVEFYDTGTARFASSQEFIISKKEESCCEEGFTLVKLGLGLGKAETPGPIEGIIAHELAHRVLDHIRQGHTDCSAEREANALIKQWGFGEEFKQAGEMFGSMEGDPAACQERR